MPGVLKKKWKTLPENFLSFLSESFYFLMWMPAQHINLPVEGDFERLQVEHNSCMKEKYSQCYDITHPRIQWLSKPNTTIPLYTMMIIILYNCRSLKFEIQILILVVGCGVRKKYNTQLIELAINICNTNVSILKFETRKVSNFSVHYMGVCSNFPHQVFLTDKA